MSPSRPTQLVAAFGAVILIALGAGCGGDDDGDQLSQSAFLDRANQICADSNERIERAADETFGRANGSPDPNALATFFDLLKTEIRGQIDGVAALRAPSELEDEIDVALAKAEEEYDQMVAEVDADPSAFAGSETDPFAETNSMMAEIGLTACSGA